MSETTDIADLVPEKDEEEILALINEKAQEYQDHLQEDMENTDLSRCLLEGAIFALVDLKAEILGVDYDAVADEMGMARVVDI